MKTNIFCVLIVTELRTVIDNCEEARQADAHSAAKYGGVLEWEEKLMSKKDSELQNDANRQKENLLGTIFLSVLSVLFIVIGVCVLFVQKIQIVYLLYAIAAIIIVLGIGMMIRYYVRQAYRNVHDYSFSCGALLVILGGC